MELIDVESDGTEGSENDDLDGEFGDNTGGFGAER